MGEKKRLIAAVTNMQGTTSRLPSAALRRAFLRVGALIQKIEATRCTDIGRL